MSTFNTALEITVLGMIGIFVFMAILYFAIKGIDKLFPKKN